MVEGSKRLKYAENKCNKSGFKSLFLTNSTSSNSFRFRSQRALHIQNLSNCSRHKYDQSISRIFGSNIWRVFAIWSNCSASVMRKRNGSTTIYLESRASVSTTSYRMSSTLNCLGNWWRKIYLYDNSALQCCRKSGGQ